ncbi:hypothetical protein DCAR_0830690 [Daucus carota subsp. sativus]|uniref:Uncharacterized protein n=1 Tax=Daucus carota subsp. sativus TaxID=79200 RepID=A0A175YK39_DAUCS|nr:hypothetical protein DCAR_0830690 [Daucus carota subsp. sativus]
MAQEITCDLEDDEPLKNFKTIKKEQNNMIHAFIPGECGKKFINKLTVESLYVINNFTVQP